MLNQRSDKVELLRIAEAVALEKSIDKEIILSSMETAIQKAARTKFGSENDIRAKIDRLTGDISLHKVLTIVETPGNPDTEISLNTAAKIKNKNDLKIGDELFEELPPVDFGRVGMLGATQDSGVIARGVFGVDDSPGPDLLWEDGDGDELVDEEELTALGAGHDTLKAIINNLDQWYMLHRLRL